MAKRDLKAYVTNETLDQAVESITEGMDNLLKEIKKTLRRELEPMKTDIKDVRRQLTDLKVDTPTRREFEDLKSRVDTYHPLT
jgi:prefoldin subunit 5